MRLMLLMILTMISMSFGEQMNNSNFEKIEQELKVTLPDFYKSIMSDYPFKAEDNEDFIEDNLVKDVEWILQENMELRKDGFLDQKWSSKFYVIGHDGCGNYYFIDLDNPKSSVYYAQTDEEFNAKDIEELMMHETIEEFIEECIELQQELLDE